MSKNRPRILRGFTQRVETDLGAMYITVNIDPETQRPVEIFCQIGKSGFSSAADAEALGRLSSLLLRTGNTVGEIEEQLRGAMNNSLPEAITRVLDPLNRHDGKVLTITTGGVNVCPKCGKQTIEHNEDTDRIYCRSCQSTWNNLLRSEIV